MELGWWYPWGIVLWRLTNRVGWDSRFGNCAPFLGEVDGSESHIYRGGVCWQEIHQLNLVPDSCSCEVIWKIHRLVILWSWNEMCQGTKAVLSSKLQESLQPGHLCECIKPRNDSRQLEAGLVLWTCAMENAYYKRPILWYIQMIGCSVSQVTFAEGFRAYKKRKHLWSILFVGGWYFVASKAGFSEENPGNPHQNVLKFEASQLCGRFGRVS